MPRIDLYARNDEKKKILEVAEKLGKSVSWCLLHAFDYWLENNPKELNDLAEEFHSLRLEREAKERERDTGDLLGSFEKKEKKIERIKEAWRKGRISEEFKKMLIKQTEEDYKITQTAKEERLRRELRKDRAKRIQIEHQNT